MEFHSKWCRIMAVHQEGPPRERDLTEEDLVEAFVGNEFVDEELLFRMCAVAQQVYHVPMLHTCQQLRLVRELLLPLIRRLRKLLHRNLPPILQFPLFHSNPTKTKLSKP